MYLFRKLNRYATEKRMEYKSILDRDEKKELLDVLTFKNNLMSYIGMDKLITEISDIIKTSEHFTFRNESAEKYIDKENPIFIIKVKEEMFNTIDRLPVITRESNEKDLDVYRNIIYSLVGTEIVSNTSMLMDKYIIDNEELTSKFESFDVDIRDLILSNLFGVTITSPLDNMIHLRVIL